MKRDPRFEDVQIDKDVVCPGCGYTIQTGSVAHKYIAENKVYCMPCYRDMRSLD